LRGTGTAATTAAQMLAMGTTIAVDMNTNVTLEKEIVTVTVIVGRQANVETGTAIWPLAHSRRVTTAATIQARPAQRKEDIRENIQGFIQTGGALNKDMTGLDMTCTQ